MKTLTFIWHDCFVYNDENSIVVFDYWKDPVSDNQSLPRFIATADKDKHLYVVISHHHKDHYNTCVFEWEKYFRNTTYIISKDIKKYSRFIFSETSVFSGYKPDIKNVVALGRGETYEDSRVKIEAYGSTDIGNSYALEVNGVTLFHAGDLNAWLWKDESTPAEIKGALDGFERVITDIAEKHSAFDIVMFPVDSRIGTDYFEGASIFVRKFDVRHFFPMHFCLGETEEERDKYIRDATAIENYANPERGEYICLTSPFSKFAFP